MAVAPVFAMGRVLPKSVLSLFPLSFLGKGILSWRGRVRPVQFKKSLFAVTAQGTSLGVVWLFQAVVFLSPEDLLKGEMEESLGKVQTVFDILNAFKGAFEERQKNLHMYYEPGQEVRKWNFHPRLVFARLDSFLQRLDMVKVRLWRCEVL